MATHRMLTTLLALSAFSIGGHIHAQDAAPASSAARAADDTGVNARDRSHTTATSSSQPNDKSDVALAAAVRRALTNDSSLSTLGHNIKLVAASGTVTLRGPVESDEEKARIESTARSVAGVQQVDNQLEVKH
jgi:hyperosmotically inducible periplasmic protein